MVKLVIDDNDDYIKYSKGWHTKGAPKVHYTEQYAATASISFNGSFITVFGVVPSYNEFPALGLNATTILRSSYRINGGPPEFFNVTLTAEHRTDQVFFQPSNTLLDGPHTLVITNLGGPLMLDYFTMVPQSFNSSLSTTSSMNYLRIWKIDDTSTNITYNNAKALSDTNQADYDSTLHSLSYPQSTAFLNFNGDFIAVYGALPEVGPLPNVSFTLDNITQLVPSRQSDPQSSIPPLPTTRKGRISQVLFWKSSILDDIPHNLSITAMQGEFLLDFILIRSSGMASLPLSPQPTNNWLYGTADCASTQCSPSATLSSTPSSSDPGNISAIVGGVLGTVLIVLILCIVYLLSKRRSYLRPPTRSNSKPSHQTSDLPASSRTGVARDKTKLHPVDGSGRPVKLYIPSSSVASSRTPSYRSMSETHNGQDLHVDHGGNAKKKGELVQEVTYGHGEKFAMFRQQ